VTSALTGQGASARLYFYSATGSYLGYVWTNGDGSYLSPGLPAGSVLAKIDRVEGNLVASSSTTGLASAAA